MIEHLTSADPDIVSSAALLEVRAASDPDRVFLRFEDRVWTYAETCREVAGLAGGFSAHGVGRGDRVALMLPNSPEFVFASLALAWVGAVEVPLNTALKGEVLRHQIANSALSLAVVHADYVDAFRPAGDGVLAAERLVVAGKGDECRELDSRTLAAHEPVPRVSTSMADLAVIIYTSGTTGHAKGVEVTHGHAHRFAGDWIRALAFTREDILMTPLPLFHSIARTLGVLPTLMLGAQICLVERFSASRFWDQARGCAATVVHGVFGMVPILLAQRDRSDDRDHSVRRFYCASSALSEAFEERFGVQLIEVYGSTETGIVTMIAPGQQPRPGSCGRANDQTYEVVLLDEADAPVPDGVVGEFAVRPRVPWSLLTGYYASQAETITAFRNLWFHTGDFGRRDADGYFYFVDRKKDAIRRRGENITSAEVEAEINAHPDVLECAVIAVPAEIGEDEVKACVVLDRAATLDPAELIHFLDRRLPYFMIPRYVEFCAELPKTANGKVQKQKLRLRGDRGLTDLTWDREVEGITLWRPGRGTGDASVRDTDVSRQLPRRM